MHGNVIGPAANWSIHQSLESKQGAVCSESQKHGSLPWAMNMAELHLLWDLTSFVTKSIKLICPQEFCTSLLSIAVHNCLLKLSTFNFIDNEIDSVKCSHTSFEHPSKPKLRLELWKVPSRTEGNNLFCFRKPAIKRTYFNSFKIYS